MEMRQIPSLNLVLRLMESSAAELRRASVEGKAKDRITATEKGMMMKKVKPNYPCDDV
jgi:hypothetical protein